MSKALLKRSLEIVEGSSLSANKTTGKGVNKFAVKKPKTIAPNPFAPSSATNEQNPAYRAVIRKHKPAKKPTSSSAPKPSSKNAAKSSIEQAHEFMRLGKSRADQNLSKLLMLSTQTVKLDDKTQAKLIRRAQSRRYVVDEPDQDAGDAATAFTDEDFEKFEREYFCQ